MVKLPASSLAGLPDWLLVEPGQGVCLVEAKLRRPMGAAFVRSQLTRAQRFFLECVSRFGGIAYVLILDPSGFVEWCVDPDHGVENCDQMAWTDLREDY